MIMSFSYFDSLIFDLLSHPSNFNWPNFINLALVLYILYCFLHNETILLKFIYKIINIIYIVNNIYIKIIILKFLK